MKQLLQYQRQPTPRAVDIPDPIVRPRMVLIRTHASLISAGTERSSVAVARSSLVSKAKSRPDLVRQVLRTARTEGVVSTMRKVRHRLAEPFCPGYSASGVVVGVDSEVKEYRVGDRVACGGQDHASHAELINVPTNLVCPLPEKLGFDEGAFVAVGSVALQGVRTAQPQIGETVLVIGLGLVGQLTVQLLSAQGCRVLGCDPDETRRGLAQSYRNVITGHPDNITGLVAAQTSGIGADSIIVCAASDSSSILETAFRVARDRAVVVVVGDVPLAMPRADFYRKELQLRMSRSYGPGRYDPHYEEQGTDYPAGYVRWTENRNMRAFLDLVASGQIDCLALITHRFPIDDAEAAYQTIESDGESLAVVFEYSSEREGLPVVRHRCVKRAKRSTDRFGVGFWGCGHFAGGVLAPIFAMRRDVEMIAVSTQTPVGAEQASRRYGFARATCDGVALLAMDDIDLVVIATPHREHASMAMAALKSGRSVFLEKPVATTFDELLQLTEVAAEYGGRIQVGFNRRYSPALCAIREAFPIGTPKTVIYRVQAGPPPTEGWLSDPEHGGRLIGEVAHFVDAILTVTGSWPKRVWAERVGPDAHDGVCLHMSLIDGSAGTVIYATDGDAQTPKEWIEVIGDGITAQIDDYRRWTIRRRGRSVTHRGRRNKGHSEQIAALFEALKCSDMVAGDWNAAVAATLVTLAAKESIQTGQPVAVDPWI